MNTYVVWIWPNILDYCNLFNGQYQYVDLKDGIYSKTVSYKRVPIDPQPDPSSILTIRRMYNSLKHQLFPLGIEVSDAEALVTMSMNISESKNAPLLLFSGVDVRDFTATLVLTG
jgi:hypothetical protein